MMKKTSVWFCFESSNWFEEALGRLGVKSPVCRNDVESPGPDCAVGIYGSVCVAAK